MITVCHFCKSKLQKMDKSHEAQWWKSWECPNNCNKLKCISDKFGYSITAFYEKYKVTFIKENKEGFIFIYTLNTRDEIYLTTIKNVSYRSVFNPAFIDKHIKYLNF